MVVDPAEGFYLRLIPPLEDRVPALRAAGTGTLQQPGGGREGIHGGSCSEEKEHRKTVKTLLIVRKGYLGRGMEGFK